MNEKEDLAVRLRALRHVAESGQWPPDQIKAAIAALEKRVGVFTDPRTGLHHLNDPLVTMIRDLPPVKPQ